MSNAGMTRDNMILTAPEVLMRDSLTRPLVELTAWAAAQIAKESALPMIYARIDSLPETVLDVLAKDFKVDWWSPDYSIEEKRKILKDSWYVHKHLGTTDAVERAVSAIYPDSRVVEWFEYGGEPYHFVMQIQVEESQLDLSKHDTVLRSIDYYKNLRSVLDDVEYVGGGGQAGMKIAAAFTGMICTITATAKQY